MSRYVVCDIYVAFVKLFTHSSNPGSSKKPLAAEAISIL